MSSASWLPGYFRRLCSSWWSGHRRTLGSCRRGATLTVAILEDRLAPAVLTVNSLVDAPISGTTSSLNLREAIALINSGGTATDLAGNNLGAAKASQIDSTSPFGTGDTIRFDPVMFAPAQQLILEDGQIELSSDVAIVGPGASELAVSGNDQTRVFQVDAPATVVISGLTVESGATTLADVSGGGILNLGTLTLVNTAVSGNSAGSGAGIGNVGGRLTLTDSTVSGNAAIAAGGIANYGGTLTLIDSAVSGNSASGGGGIVNTGTASLINSSIFDNSVELEQAGDADTTGLALTGNLAPANSANGAGLFNTGTLSLTGSTVADNSAQLDDAGIVNYSAGTVVLADSSISGNVAGLGNGGIANYGGLMKLTNSTVTGNKAIGAGGLGNYDGLMTIADSTVSGNMAVGDGGLVNTGTLTLVGSTVSGNMASSGAGIGNYGTLTLIDSTVSGNSASGGGGGIVNAGLLTLTGSAVTGNSASGGGGLVNLGTVSLTDSTITGNLVRLDNAGVANTPGLELTGNMAAADTATGGGIANFGTLTLTNSSVSGNVAGSGDDIANAGTVLDDAGPAGTTSANTSPVVAAGLNPGDDVLILIGSLVQTGSFSQTGAAQPSSTSFRQTVSAASANHTGAAAAVVHAVPIATEFDGSARAAAPPTDGHDPGMDADTSSVAAVTVRVVQRDQDLLPEVRVAIEACPQDGYGQATRGTAESGVGTSDASRRAWEPGMVPFAYDGNALAAYLALPLALLVIGEKGNQEKRRLQFQAELQALAYARYRLAAAAPAEH
jgi:hypothetical protein